jgi:hypothetical protein
VFQWDGKKLVKKWWLRYFNRYLYWTHVHLDDRMWMILFIFAMEHA